MKILLVGINAKYIHSNPAIYSLKAYAEKKAGVEKGIVSVAEYTINTNFDEILAGVYKEKPDIAAFSTYIWNAGFVRDIIREMKKVSPDTQIWLGGPEVSFDSETIFERYPECDIVMLGEGEKSFSELSKIAIDGRIDACDALDKVDGIAYKKDGILIVNEPGECLDLSEVPFIYDNLDDFKDRIMYYETSRGCPFKCAYCLSSVEKSLRFRDINLVKKELKIFLENDVPQVKFVDRTFNCNEQRTLDILEFIKDNDNGVTNFHFEIAGDILTDKECEILTKLRPGLVQLEIGVQSTNPETLKAINRVTDAKKLWKNTELLRKAGNMHIHLDLIAGLPYENLESFKNSFNEVYSYRPNELQLGFLKLLYGAPIKECAKEHAMCFRSNPPYEVLKTAYISFDEMLELKAVEKMLEIYYNSGQFTETVKECEMHEASAYDFYRNLASFYEEKGYMKMQSSRAKKYEILLEYVGEMYPEAKDRIRDLLTLDFYARENAKNRPDFASPYAFDDAKNFYADEKRLRDCVGSNANTKSIKHEVRYEKFEHIGNEATEVILDYRLKNPVTGNVIVRYI